MTRHTVSPLLRFALRLDAVASFATGLALVLFFTPLASLFALPAALLLGAGLFCIGYALVVGSMSRKARLPGWAVWAVIVGNFAWAAECAMLAFGDFAEPTYTGKAFLVFQAIAVFAFAELQWFGLRRSAVTTAPAAA
ncbi:MAG TPA: hypothetical protein VFL14_09220 [Xanthomonadales bacterium]|nr:hypothetical protein [Xanthomonadales bacterium]